MMLLQVVDSYYYVHVYFINNTDIDQTTIQMEPNKYVKFIVKVKENIFSTIKANEPDNMFRSIFI